MDRFHFGVLPDGDVGHRDADPIGEIAGADAELAEGEQQSGLMGCSLSGSGRMALTFVGFRSCLAAPYAIEFVPFREILTDGRAAICLPLAFVSAKSKDSE